jgi:hypothetical protein
MTLPSRSNNESFFTLIAGKFPAGYGNFQIIALRPICLLFFTMFGVSWSSCQKDDTVNPSGNIAWTVQVKHHAQIVSDARVWIKSGVTQFPGQDTGVYEYGLNCDAVGEVSFTELLPGAYYLYCEGNDGVDDVIGALGQPLADTSSGKVVTSVLLVTE